MTGGTALTGRVRVTGAKNSALKLMAAALLAAGRDHHRRGPRHPRRRDHERGAAAAGLRGRPTSAPPAAAAAAGCVVDVPGEPVDRDRLRPGPPDARLDQRARPAGRPLRHRPGGAARRRRDRLPRPGHAHLRAWSGWAPRSSASTASSSPPRPRLTGTSIWLDFPSVGATENLVMAAVLAAGHHGHRQRGPRAGDRRPLHDARRDGRPHRRRRHLHDHRRGRRRRSRRSPTRRCPTGSWPAPGRSARS